MIDRNVIMILFKFPHNRNFIIGFSNDKDFEYIKNELILTNDIPEEYNKVIKDSSSLSDLKDKLNSERVEVSIKAKL